MSIFDTARNLLKQLQSKASNTAGQIVKSAQTTDWGGVANQGMNAFNQNQKLAPWSMSQSLPQIPKVNVPQIQIKNPVGNFAYNQLARPIAESFINTPGNLQRGSNLINQGLNTRQFKPLLQGIGYTGEAALNILPFGKGVQIAKTFVKPTIMQGIKQGAKVGAGYGGAYGLSGGLQSGDFSPMNLLKSTGIGAGLGGLLGGGGGAIGGLIGKYTNHSSKVEGQLRDLGGRYKAGDVPIKPPQMPKNVWDFQIEFNKKYGRNPYEMVTASDIQKAASYEVEKRGAGLSIRDVNKDKNPLGVKLPQTQLPEQVLPQKGQVLPQASGLNTPVSPSSPNIIAQDVKKVLTGQSGVKERGFITSVKESAKTPQAVKDIIAGSYVPKATNSLRTDAKLLIKADPQAAEQLALNPRNANDVQIGHELINHYGSIGDFNKAKQITEGMAQSGTEFGQAVQAFANYDKTTPQGALKFAQQSVNTYNKSHANKPLTLGSDQVKSLFERATKVQQMAEGRERNIAANDLINEINNLIPSSFADKAVTVWKAGLLTSLRTHERNIIGNTIHGLAEISKDVPGTITDKLLSLKTGQRSLTFTTKGMGSGARTGLQSAEDLLKRGYDPEQAINKYDVRHVTWGKNKLEQGLKVYTNAVFRTLGAADKPFWNAAMARSLYDQAGAKAINAGQRGNKAFIENLVKNATPEMKGLAIKDANVSTFKNTTALSNIAKNVQGVKIGGVPVGQIVAPFTGVPSSIAGQMVAYSPIGLLKGIYSAGKVLVKNVPDLQRQASQEIGRGVMGTGLFGLGAYLTSKGLMTGQPKDAQESAQWQLEGKQANAVLIGGKWRAIGSIGPENLIILAGAKAQEELQKGDASAGNYAATLGKDFMGQTFLQGMSAPLNAITDPNRYGPSYLGNQSASIIPNIVKDTAKSLDPYARENNTFQDYLTNNIPLWRNKGIVRRDNLGNPIKQEPTGINAFIDLFNSKAPINNTVVNELKRLNDSGTNATPSKLSKSQTIGKVKVTLTPQELNTFEAMVGRYAQDMLPKLISSPGYKAGTDEQKAKAIDNIMTKIKTGVKSQLPKSGVSGTPTGKTSSGGTSREQQIVTGIKSAQTPAQKQAVWDYYSKQGYITSANIEQVKSLLAK